MIKVKKEETTIGGAMKILYYLRQFTPLKYEEVGDFLKNINFSQIDGYENLYYRMALEFCSIHWIITDKFIVYKIMKEIQDTKSMSIISLTEEFLALEPKLREGIVNSFVTSLKKRRRSFKITIPLYIVNKAYNTNSTFKNTQCFKQEIILYGAINLEPVEVVKFCTSHNEVKIEFKIL